MPILLDSLDLNKAEKTLCIKALETEGTIAAASVTLGITRHALKRRIIKHQISWPKS